MADWARHAGLTEARVDDLVLGVDEAASNVVEHAYPHPNGLLSVLAQRRYCPARVEVTVTDNGRWQRPPRAPGDRGRGLYLIQQLADHVDVRSSDHGTVVLMTWRVFT